MSQARMLSIVMIVVGLVLAVVSAFADQIGLGAPGSTFGWKQLLGTVIGIAILIAGVILLRQGDVVYEDDEAVGEPAGETQAAEAVESERPA